MEKKLILLSLIKNEVAATAVTKEVIEAAVFWAIRAGAKKMMVVHADTYQLLTGEEAFNAAVDRGDTEAEVLLCDPAAPAIAELAVLNADKLNTALKTDKKYDYLSPWEFERDTEHAEHFKYDDAGEYEGTAESYRKFDRIKPVYYIEYLDGDKVVRAVIDGWKYVLFAREKGMEKIFACRLLVGNNDDLLSIMFQLQRSNYDSFMALYRMIQALWPKYYKGPGFRSDMTDTEIEKVLLEDTGGRRMDIYRRIGIQLNLSGTRVKHILKVGKVNPLHFERIEIGRFTLFQAYQECVKEQNQQLPPVPTLKAPTYHTSSTPMPQFTKPDTTAGDVGVEYAEYTEVETDTGIPTTDADTGYDDIPVGKVVAVTEEYFVVQGKCQHCGKETLLKIYKPKK